MHGMRGGEATADMLILTAGRYSPAVERIHTVTPSPPQ